MKSLIISLAMLSSVAAFAQDDAVELPTVSSPDEFVQPLQPYGQWVDVRGTRAFRPDVAVVGADFTPYSSGGQWVNTDAGWVFESSYPFAWATYHYGRWFLDPNVGWVWVPDTTWGPSWVDWRYGGGYAGWSPLPPPMFASYYSPRWVFVESRYIGDPGWYGYRVPGNRIGSVVAVTTVVPARSWRGSNWHMGPAYNEVARVSSVPPPRRNTSAYAPPPSFRGEGRSRVGMPPPPSGGRNVAASNNGTPPPPSPGGTTIRNNGAPPPPNSGGNRGSVAPPPATGGTTIRNNGAPPPPPSGGNRGAIAPVPASNRNVGAPPAPQRMSPIPSAPPPAMQKSAGPSPSMAPAPAPMRMNAPPPSAPARMSAPAPMAAPAPARSAPGPAPMAPAPGPSRGGGGAPPPPPRR